MGLGLVDNHPLTPVFAGADVCPAVTRIPEGVLNIPVGAHGFPASAQEIPGTAQETTVAAQEFPASVHKTPLGALNQTKNLLVSCG